MSGAVPSFSASALCTQRDLGYAPEQFVAAAMSNVVWWMLCVFAAFAPVAHAQNVQIQQGQQGQQGQQTTASGDALQSQVESLLKQQSAPQDGEGARSKQPWRVEVVLGQLDPRLKLAPCDKVHAYMPAGSRMWGKTRVGLRCEQGPVKWNVYWPVTVKVWGQALVAAVPLRTDSALTAADLTLAEVDLAASPSPAVMRAGEVVGRFPARSIEAGQSLRQDDVKARRWFAAGDPVRLIVRGAGFQMAAEGTALMPGDEGHCARVRTESGKVVCGQPTGERQVELAL